MRLPPIPPPHHTPPSPKDRGLNWRLAHHGLPAPSYCDGDTNTIAVSPSFGNSSKAHAGTIFIAHRVIPKCAKPDGPPADFAHMSPAANTNTNTRRILRHNASADEDGLFVSIDRGYHWRRLTGGRERGGGSARQVVSHWTLALRPGEGRGGKRE